MRQQPNGTPGKKPTAPSVKVRPGRKPRPQRASPSQKRRLSRQAHQALELLAVDPRGLAEALLLTYGFTRDLLAGLLHAGLATAQRQAVKVGGETIKVVRFRITDAGRRAIEG